MHVSEDGSVTGSVDRSKLEELEANATTDEAKTQLRQLRGETEVTGSVTAEAEVAESEPKVSMALSKDELVDLAEAAGLGDRDELEQRTKQQLVDDLRAGEG